MASSVSDIRIPSMAQDVDVVPLKYLLKNTAPEAKKEALKVVKEDKKEVEQSNTKADQQRVEHETCEVRGTFRVALQILASLTWQASRSAPICHALMCAALGRLRPAVYHRRTVVLDRFALHPAGSSLIQLYDLQAAEIQYQLPAGITSESCSLMLQGGGAISHKSPIIRKSPVLLFVKRWLHALVWSQTTPRNPLLISACVQSRCSQMFQKFRSSFLHVYDSCSDQTIDHQYELRIRVSDARQSSASLNFRPLNTLTFLFHN